MTEKKKRRRVSRLRVKIEKIRLEQKAIETFKSIVTSIFNNPTSSMLTFLLIGKGLEIHYNKKRDYESSGVIKGMNDAIQTALYLAYGTDLIRAVLESLRRG